MCIYIHIYFLYVLFIKILTAYPPPSIVYIYMQLFRMKIDRLIQDIPDVPAHNGERRGCTHAMQTRMHRKTRPLNFTFPRRYRDVGSTPRLYTSDMYVCACNASIFPRHLFAAIAVATSADCSCIAANSRRLPPLFAKQP